MTDISERPDVSTLTYEQARDELVEVVASLEDGAATLEDSLALWERGEALAAHCEQWLVTAQERLAAAGAESPETPASPQEGPDGTAHGVGAGSGNGQPDR